MGYQIRVGRGVKTLQRRELAGFVILQRRALGRRRTTGRLLYLLDTHKPIHAVIAIGIGEVVDGSDLRLERRAIAIGVVTLGQPTDGRKTDPGHVGRG